MKVIQVLNTSEYSGAENVAIGICEEVRERGFEVAYASRIASIGDVVRQHGIHYIGLNDITVKEVRRMVRREKADIIHAHDIYAGLVCALATIGTKCRLVTTLHNNDFENRKVSVKSVLYLIPLIRTMRAFFVSKSCYEGYVFHKWFAKKSEILGNIIDVENVIEKGAGAMKKWDIVYVGRLMYQKDPLRLVGVIGLVKKKKADVKVALAGIGDMMEETKAEIERLGLTENIEVMGFRKDAMEIMVASKVMLMTSRWEGTPMVALEAMALRVPIVSTPADGMRDVVDEKWLSDNDDELAEKVLDIIENGCEGYVWYEGLSRDEYFDKLMKAYLTKDCGYEKKEKTD